MIDTARILFTVVCFVAFVLIVLITYRKGAKSGYDDIAREVVDDDDLPAENTKAESTHGNGANK